MTPKTLILPALALIFACGPAMAQNAGRDPAGFPAPDRPVAEIVSPIWATEAERDEVRETQQAFAAAGIKPGQTVADIGAGSGYYVVRLSPAVGPAGRVYAQDIVPRYLADLQARIDKLGLKNLTLVKGTSGDPMLPKAALDVAFLVHMYHEIEDPYGLLWRLGSSMKPGGRVVIIDADRETQNHGTRPSLLKCELAAVGYRQISLQELKGDVGYLAIFEPPAPGKLPAPASIKPCKAN